MSAEDHAAVFAYLLEVNGYHAGTAAVAPGAQGLLRAPRWVRARLSASAEANASGAPPAPPAFIEGEKGAVPASNGPDQAALSAAATSTDWLHYTHDYSGTRYSPLDQINAANASRLVAGLHVPGRRDGQLPDRAPSSTPARCT